MQFDGSYVDIASIATAMLSPTVKPIRVWMHNKKNKTNPIRFEHNHSSLVIDILHGASLVPFLLLFGCVFSSDLLKEAVERERVFFGIAGIMGVLFVIGEIRKLTANGAVV